MNAINSNTPFLVNRAQSRFIQLDEECVDKLSSSALKVYSKLRFLTDYSKPSDEVEVTIKYLATEANISERQVYRVLNELEYEHCVIQRMNYHHFRYGKINSYNVARDYGFFKNSVQLNPGNKQLEPKLNTPDTMSGLYNHLTPLTSMSATPDMDVIPNNKTESLHIKQNKQGKVIHRQSNDYKLLKGKPKISVSVFLDKKSVRDHILNIVEQRHQEALSEELLDQGIYYAFTTNPDTQYNSVQKRINIFLKKVREKQWLVPSGWNGITAQSIAAQEETQKKVKEEQNKQDAKIFQQITDVIINQDRNTITNNHNSQFKAHSEEINKNQYKEKGLGRKIDSKPISVGSGLAGFREMYKKLKEDVYGAVNSEGMQAHPV